jgi:hypothetical protein
MSTHILHAYNGLTLPRSKNRTSKPQAKTQDESDSGSSPASPKRDNGPRPIQPFRPPNRFETITDLAQNREIANIFRPANTRGKQIWWITAPQSVPISSLKEVALEKFVKGEAMITHEGKEYGFTTDDQLKATTSLALPGDSAYDIGT